MKDGLRVGLLYGGEGNEAAVSEKSAAEVLQELNQSQFRVFPIEISKTGWLYRPSEGGAAGQVDLRDLSIVVGGARHKLDVCFIALHGAPGENGQIQGFLDLLNMPYTSVFSVESAVTFNKRYTIATAHYYGLHVAKHVFFHRGEIGDFTPLSDALRLPVFVKPCEGGSSIGVSLLSEWDGVAAAVSLAFEQDDEVMIEEKIPGRVFTIGVFRLNGKVVIAPPLLCHLEAGSKEFFDYETKTTSNGYSSLVPGTLPTSELMLLEDFATRVFRIFGNRGVMRIDAVLCESDGLPYLLEVNTIPGMTRTSALPVMVEAAGWTRREFYEALILEAVNQG
jgi:D-alanine-D-alanine ligase